MAAPRTAVMPHSDFSLGTVIRVARRKLALTQEDVAKHMGVSKPSVWAWEQNRAVPTDDKIEMLAELLEVPAEALRKQLFRGHEAVVGRCRQEIAASLGVSPDVVKITLEL